MEPFPIDVVITWVDGDDPAHRARRARFVRGDEAAHDDIAGETRFREAGEIAFCVASVLRFAPFVRKIFIVTDNQAPRLNGFIGANFPDNRTPIEIVDHTVIFRGYEQYLPTFNSLSIETMLWRIPGLAEHFVYMNDDFMIISPLAREDFFDSRGLPLCYADNYSTLWAETLRALKPRRHSHKPFGFKDSMLNALYVAGRQPHFPHIEHTPLPLRRSFFERFYTEHPEAMERNIRHRFRDASQFNPQSLFYTIAQRDGDCITVPTEGTFVYMKPKDKKKYVTEKLKRFDASAAAKFCCINSLDKASAEDRRAVSDWLCRRIRLKTESNDAR